MASCGIHIIALLVLVCLVVAAPAASAITCGQVASYASSCIPYVRGAGIRGQPPPPPCCNGFRGLNSAARTTNDRRVACNCLKTLARAIPGLNTGLVAGLPRACGVSLPFAFSTSTDCSRIN